MSMSKGAYSLSFACGWICLFGIYLWCCMGAADGRLIYTLDDPYIHLALAEMIATGHYGINPGEAASPSSSILYPFLLAAGHLVGLGDVTPLVLQIAAAVLLLWLLGAMYFDATGRVNDPARMVLRLFLIPLTYLGLNLFGLPMTGMEHVPHLLVSVLAIAGLARTVRTSEVPITVGVALVLAPLLRFEGLALSGLGVIVLALLGHRHHAATVGLLIVLALVAYVAVMLCLGLPPLPSSVMVKSELGARAMSGNLSGVVGALASSDGGASVYKPLYMLAFSALAMLAFTLAVLRRDGRGIRLVALVPAGAIAAHVVAGDFDWFSRYEVYLLAMAAAGFAVMAAGSCGAHRTATLVALVVMLTGGSLLYTRMLWRGPAAVANVYQQQYQMHRFATEFFPRPVAVNDLGWVAYRNDRYVLDLWGLGSEEARQMTEAGSRGPDGVRALAAGKDISAAMIYGSWLGKAMPPEWCRAAVLETSRVSSAEGRVDFYLADRRQRAAFETALEAFSASLPRGARLLRVGGCDV